MMWNDFILGIRVVGLIQSRVSQYWHYEHFRLDNSFLRKAVLCITGYLEVCPTLSTMCQEHLHPQFSRPEMPLDMPRCSLGSKVASG